MRPAINILTDARLLLIALWLGGAVFFSFVVAPSAFAVLPARALAGLVVNRTLGVLNTGGFVAALFLLVTSFAGSRGVSRRARLGETVSLGLVAGASAVGRWIIAARLEALRLAMARPIDEIAPGDPLRVAFGRLHGYSVAVLLVGMIAATAALLLISRRRAGRDGRE